MNDLWARLEAYATSHAKRSLGLRPGASEAAITAAERAMNVALPRDFRESLALHDGQTATDDTFEWLPGCSPLVSLDAMVARWKEERDLDESAEPDGKA